LYPDVKNNWLTEGLQDDYQRFVPLLPSSTAPCSVFGAASSGIKTCRDVWVFNFQFGQIEASVKRTVEFYDSELRRWRGRTDESLRISDFVLNNDSEISWSEGLKLRLSRETELSYDKANIRPALYRPFTSNELYFDGALNERRYSMPQFFPGSERHKNHLICLTGPGSEKPFLAMAACYVVDSHLSGAGCTTQCFPFYAYNEEGSNRRENITDWALSEFRTHYGDPNITKWDIFHYVYAVLHHPEYRERYAANLRRELPRIPFVGGTADPSARAEALGRDDSAWEGGDARTANAPVPLRGTEDDSPALQRWVGNDRDPESLQGRQKTADPSARAEALGRDDNMEKSSTGRAGLQASVNAATSLPGAGLQPGGTSESPKGDTVVAQGVSPGSACINNVRVPSGTTQKAGPSTPRSSAAADDLVARDDKGKGDAERGAQPQSAQTQRGLGAPVAPLYPDATGPEGRLYATDKDVFWAFAKAGQRLADLHVNYEQQREYPLERVEKGQLNWRVQKMRLSKDKTTLVYNDFLTLRAIPMETYEYRLGNRSALEWVVDQYQVSTDKRSGIVNDPNRADDPEYIVRLIGQVVTVSLETRKIIKALPVLAIPGA
jgi:hypothetical protein